MGGILDKEYLEVHWQVYSFVSLPHQEGFVEVCIGIKYVHPVCVWDSNLQQKRFEAE